VVVSIPKNTEPGLRREPSDPSLVPFAAEEGKIYISLTKKLVKEHLYSLQRKKIDTVILGSTHYPFLKKKL